MVAFIPKNKLERQRFFSFLLFIAPWFLVGVLFLTLFPLIWGGYISLTNYTGFNIKNLKFLGLSNYIRAYNDPGVIQGILRTLYITLLGVPLRVIGGFALALLLNQRLKGQGLFRMLFYLPSIIPITATALVWQQILAKNAGLLNLLLEQITGQRGLAINWLLDYSNESLIMLYMWGLGGGMVIYLAGLQNVPAELKEAAYVDGANSVQIFFKVTLPLMTPLLLFQTIIELIWSLQILVPALLLVPGKGEVSTLLAAVQIPPKNRLFMVHLFEQAFVRNRFGYGLALAWILFIFIMLLSFTLLKTSKSWVYYEVDVEE